VVLILEHLGLKLLKLRLVRHVVLLTVHQINVINHNLSTAATTSRDGALEETSLPQLWTGEQVEQFQNFDCRAIRARLLPQMRWRILALHKPVVM
jgi:hypothetical protein